MTKVVVRTGCSIERRLGEQGEEIIVEGGTRRVLLRDGVWGSVSLPLFEDFHFDDGFEIS